MPLARVLRTAQVTHTHTFYVDGVATDASGPVTVVLARLDGTSVDTDTATSLGGGSYSYTQPAQADLDMLTLDWSGTVAGAAVTVRDYIEIVGEHLFGLDEARTTLRLNTNPTNTYSVAALADGRIAVEFEFERICRQAFVPRFARQILSGNNTARLPIPQDLPHRAIRAVRAVTVAGTAWSAPDVAAVTWSDSGVFYRPGGALWPAAYRNIVIEYEHGLDLPPQDVRDIGIIRLRYKLAQPTSALPDRAISYTTPEGGTYRQSIPGKQRTGIPDVDGVLEGYTQQRRVVFA